jgi:predicted dinucleotide-binding enzyme
MRLAIIGTGQVGAALARGFARAGHEVRLGTRDPDAAHARALAAAAGATLARPGEAAMGAEVVFLALPWKAAKEAVAGLPPLDGRIVVDCMNPLGMLDGAFGLTLGHRTSGGEEVARWLPGARVVKSLNQVAAEIMERNDHLPHRPVMFMAGDDAAAKETVAGLVADLGFEPLDAGNLTKARLLEPFAMLWINQAIVRGKGRDWAFAAVAPHSPEPEDHP